MKKTGLTSFNRLMARPLMSGNAGGVALEYILVTTFALVTTIAALGYLSRTMKSRFAELESAAITTHEGEAIWDP